MNIYENSIFISYAWGGESEDFVNKIDESLKKRGITIIRDKRNLGFRGSIKEFMEQIGRGNCVIVVVSDKYLKSPNCMFELVEIAENKDFRNRIFPVVLTNANIYDPVSRLEYVKYWEAKRKELAKAIKKVDPANLQGIREDMDNYDRFRDEISGLVSTLKDMNTLTPEIHKDSDFDALFQAIEKRIHQELSSSGVAPMENNNLFLDEEQLLEIVVRLPIALFEKLVFKLDKSGSVPGREAPQSIRALELLRLMQTQKDGINALQSEVQKFTGG